MDESGNILVRRYSKSGVFVKGTGNAGEETAIGNEILKSPNLNLELDKVMKVWNLYQTLCLTINFSCRCLT